MHEHSSPRHLAGRHRRVSANTGLITLSLGLCLCAGQLLMSSPANAATTTPVQSTVVLPVPTASETVSANTVTRGKDAVITAKVRDPRTGKFITKGVVELQQWKNNKWTYVKAALIRSNGTAPMWAGPTAYTAYRTFFPGGSGLRWAVSNVNRIGVRAASSSAGTKVLTEAQRHVGALYLFGASGPSRFDCSGFTEYVYKKSIGKSLPHKANDQQHYGVAESHSAAKPGDLIIFRSGSYGYHAAIYAGGGYMYDSPHTGARVGKHKIYTSDYVVRRLAA